MRTQRLNFLFGDLDERTDSAVLPMPRLTQVTNMYRRHDGQYAKRRGCGVIPTTDNVGNSLEARRRTWSLDHSLFTAGASVIYSYAEGDDTWREVDKAPEWMHRERRVIARGTSDLSDPTIAVSSNNRVIVVAWMRQVSGGLDQVWACAIDAVSGAYLLKPALMSDAATLARCPVAVTMTDQIVLWWVTEDSTSGDIVCRVLDTDDVDAWGALTTFLAGDVDSRLATGYACFDAARVNGSLCAIAYRDTSAAGRITLITVDTTLGAIDSVAHTLAADPINALSIDSGGNHIHACIAYAGGTIAARRWTTTFSARVDATLDTVAGITRVSAKELSSSAAVFGWAAGVSGEWRVVRSGSTLGTSVAERDQVAHSQAFTSTVSRAFYIGLLSTSTQRCFHMLSVADGVSGTWDTETHFRPHMRFADGSASSITPTVSYAARYTKPAVLDGRVLFPSAVVVDGVAGGSVLDVTGIDMHVLERNPSASSGMLRNVVAQSQSVHGSYACLFGKQTFTELGFGTVPSVTLVDAGAGGIPAGDYSYRVVWEWIDDLGNRHQSAPSVARSIALGGSRNVDVRISVQPPTRKMDAEFSGRQVKAHVYRTIAGGTIHYRLAGSALVMPTLDATLAYLTFTDNNTGATSLDSNEILYTESGELPNWPPPPTSALAVWGNRVFGIDSEYPHDVWFTKEFAYGRGIAHAAPFRATFAEGGKNIALAAQDRLLVFKRDSIWAIAGEGPNNLNQGSFYPPQEITRGIGAVSPVTVTDADGNVYFRSPRGIEVLARGSASPAVISDPVWVSTVARNSFYVLNDAVHLPERSAVAFSFTNPVAGATAIWVYDYRARSWAQWSFTGSIFQRLCAHTPLDGREPYSADLIVDGSANIWAQQSEYTIDTETFAEDTNFVSGVIATGDIRFDIVGRVQIDRVFILGEYRGTCTLTIEASYDKGRSWSESETWTLTGTAGDVVQKEWQPRTADPPSGFARYRVTIGNNASANSEGVRLNGLTFELKNMGTGPMLGSADRG